mmetsp:Transcript_36895/g.92536  ORF Transcript_36895/g.92536 Transcript_36895/m.92536 type:complete len:270 (-) Transcript_36895:1569-2378(-)
MHHHIECLSVCPSVCVSAAVIHDMGPSIHPFSIPCHSMPAFVSKVSLSPLPLPLPLSIGGWSTVTWESLTGALQISISITTAEVALTAKGGLAAVVGGCSVSVSTHVSLSVSVSVSVSNAACRLLWVWGATTTAGPAAAAALVRPSGHLSEAGDLLCQLDADLATHQPPSVIVPRAIEVAPVFEFHGAAAGGRQDASAGPRELLYPYRRRCVWPEEVVDFLPVGVIGQVCQQQSERTLELSGNRCAFHRLLWRGRGRGGAGGRQPFLTI